MESKYSNRDFEQYVKENADQYRMFPSEKVWKGINNAVHTRRKWYGFWLGFLLLLTGGAVTWVMTTYPSSKKQNAVTVNSTTLPVITSDQPSAEKVSQDIKNLLPFAKENAVITTQNNYVAAVPGTSADYSQLPVVVSKENLLKEPLDLLPTSPHRDIRIEKHPFNLITAANGTGSAATVETVPAVIEKEGDNLSAVTATVGAAPKNKVVDASPFTIESVTNAYVFKKSAKKVSWQLFVTPTVSYRKLSVNKSLDNPSAFNYPFASLSDVNKAVTHKPDLGLQIGVLGRYPITNAFKLRGGFQFNINRYDIKAYAFNGEVATIDLNGRDNGSSTISAWTNYRNFAGYKSNWLKNYYFSVSAPIGAEIKLIGNKKTNFGVASTIQPTYIIKDRAYLISTDYKNYAEVPRLVRHVNLNTSFETFINYTRGKTKWQIAPQVRYQLLSSFHNKYPVKENLFDFGVKLGVTLNE